MIDQLQRKGSVIDEDLAIEPETAPLSVETVDCDVRPGARDVAVHDDAMSGGSGRGRHAVVRFRFRLQRQQIDARDRSFPTRPAPCGAS